MKLKLVNLWAMVLASLGALAQTPEHYPPPVPEPVEMSWFNIVLYIVLPVALFVFLYFRRKKRRNKL